MASDWPNDMRPGLWRQTASPAGRSDAGDPAPGFVAPDPRARDAIRAGIRTAEEIGLSGTPLLAALMSETLPLLVNAYGQANAALILNRIAHDIRTGAAPNTARQ